MINHDPSNLAHVGECSLLRTFQVAINMPLKPNTRNLFNSATLNKMKKGAVLVRNSLAELFFREVHSTSWHGMNAAQEHEFVPTDSHVLGVEARTSLGTGE